MFSSIDDVKITCDVNGTVEVQNGENVTIRCTSFPNAQYRWTKVKETWNLKLNLTLTSFQNKRFLCAT